MSTSKLTHFVESGAARMVDVGDKAETLRTAVAAGAIEMAPETLARICAGTVDKGDVLGVARVAAICGLKRTSELIPMCHPVRVTGVDVALDPIDAVAVDGRAQLGIRATVRARDRTGVEMEALTAVTLAALTVYDMCKAIDRGMRVVDVRLVEKHGGKSGSWVRGEPDGRA
jgi:cyclic pyranopterin phosphate synthase